MTDIVKYKSFIDYPESSGVYRILYPIRDSIVALNPFFVILLGFMLIATTASYFASITISGKSRLFNSLLAASFSTFVISIFFVIPSLITVYHVLFFLGFTVLSFGLVIHYR